jgi:hypothetical protein
MAEDEEDVSKIEAIFVVGLVVTGPSVLTAFLFSHGLQRLYFILLGVWLAVSFCLLVYQHRGGFYRWLDELREELEIAKRYGEPPYKTDEIIDDVLDDDQSKQSEGTD